MDRKSTTIIGLNINRDKTYNRDFKKIKED